MIDHRVDEFLIGPAKMMLCGSPFDTDFVGRGVTQDGVVAAGVTSSNQLTLSLGERRYYRLTELSAPDGTVRLDRVETARGK